MNYFLEITKKIEEFCNTSPCPDSRTDYLKSAEKISKLQEEASVLESEGVKSIIKIYEEISKILEG